MFVVFVCATIARLGLCTAPASATLAMWGAIMDKGGAALVFFARTSHSNRLVPMLQN
jgi:hypothetical protein